ncbi:D-hexose-6-phosphate mutarotase [Sunxiuqinia sp. A32]|uniref:D-hexose-6-phosphate mutarotase n=1 Tax=Sunxiuqinia sp. A32 TaxID=3461496 RepID=UPI0040460E3F
MINIDDLDEEFGIEGELGFIEMEGELPFISISNKYAQADICLYGAHVMSFAPYNGMDLLWMSPGSFLEEGKAIRGGIPVCFPWFGPHKSNSEKPQHGFGRLMFWDVAETRSEPNGETYIRMQLESSEQTKNLWPHDFRAEMIFTVGAKLITTLKVSNTSTEAFVYGCALHTYYSISAIDHIAIEGLQGTTYYNQLNSEHATQEESSLKIQEPLTRHYLNTESPVVISDPAFRRRISVQKAGSKVTTVWNPGKETTKAIQDIPNDGYEAFVCVEATNAFDYCISLNPGETHETSAIIGQEE